MKFVGSHFLSASQLTTISEIETLFSLARKLKIFSERQKITRVLEGAILANLFFEPSTRTRISFAVAFNLLGGAVTETSGFDMTSISKGESFYDTGRVISGYADIMVVRCANHEQLEHIAQTSKIPVINAGNGVDEHPTQALLDVYTMVEELCGGNIQHFRNISIAIVGDLKQGRTVHSLVKVLSLFPDIHVFLMSSPGLSMPPEIMDLMISRGAKISVINDIREVAAEIDILYVTRIQKERMSKKDELQTDVNESFINRTLYEQYYTKQPLIMHPLPRDSSSGVPEISTDLDTHEKLSIFRQSDNGVLIRMALFSLILGVENQIFESLKEVRWHYQPK